MLARTVGREQLRCQNRPPQIASFVQNTLRDWVKAKTAIKLSRYIYVCVSITQYVTVYLFVLFVLQICNGTRLFN